MTDNQTFKLTGPAGEVIMTGSMSAIMERLPDTHACNDALSTMLDTAVKQVEAEEKLEDARACATQILHDGITRLCARLDAFEKQRAISMKRAEAERQRRDQQRVQSYLDQLPDPDAPEPIVYPPPGDLTINEPSPLKTNEPVDDDGDLEIKHAVNPERYGPNENDDEGPGDLPRELEKDVPPLSGTYTDPKPDPLGGPEAQANSTTDFSELLVRRISQHVHRRSYDP
jgi:hypothetical protein